jgi:hypothetical protein
VSERDALIESFVRDGFVLLRECFSPATAASMRRGTLVDRSPAPRVLARGRGETRAEIDFTDPSTWGGSRLYLETGRSLSIASFAPKLWRVIRTLVHPLEPTRTTMGEQWILNGDFARPPAPPLDSPYYRTLHWHLDAPSAETSFEHRLDALVLLILWSDVEPGGGGPLYSPRSLDRLVERLDAGPIDTRPVDWAHGLMASCGDVRELTGRAGDVVLTHALALHAAEPCFNRTIRVLENPMVTVDRPLDYSPQNRAPSAVERAVTARRSPAARSTPADVVREVGEALIDRHPDYFLPGRATWSARTSDRSAVHALDRLAMAQFVERTRRTIALEHEGVAAARACVAVVSELVVNQRATHAHLAESIVDDDFADTAFSRLLRGFQSCEGQNHLLALLLRGFFDRVELFESVDPTSGQGEHIVVRVESDRGWFFADAWSDFPVFYVRECGAGALDGVPEHAELDARGELRHHGLYPRAAYAGGAVRAMRWTAGHEARVALAPSDRPPPSSFEAYLRVRLDHVGGRTAGIARRYGELLAKHRIGGLTRAVIERFARREPPRTR